MRLKLEGPLTDPAELPELSGDDDQVGRTWWIDEVWYIWTGSSWQMAIATKDRP